LLRQRVLTAVILVPVFLFVAYTGGMALVAVTALLVVAGLKEFWHLLREMGLKPAAHVGYAGGLLLVAGAYLGSGGIVLTGNLIGLLLAAVLAAFLLTLVFAFPRYSVVDLAGTLFGTVYIGWLLSHLILLRGMREGFLLLLLALVLTWATDTFAYFVGSGLGRHKLCPSLSPQKTWEGALGGVAGSVLAGVVYYALIGLVPLRHVIAISLLVSVFGEIGDLAESALKRLAGVKDTGSLIPGHGGVLDRFDSVLLTVPVLYYYLNFITGMR